jgi:hypothetical protein
MDSTKTLKQQLNTANIYKPHNNTVPIPPPNFNIFHHKGDRIYISNANYLYPVDGNEIDRIQSQHDLCYLAWNNKHFSAPVNELLNTDGAKILDVG